MANPLAFLFGNKGQFNTPGINPNEPNPHGVTPQNPLDKFLGGNSGSLLMNLLAQQGYSRTPQDPLGALGRGLQQTRAQGLESDRFSLENELFRARTGLANAQATAAANTVPINGSSVFKTFPGADGNMRIITRDSQVIDTGVPYKESYVINTNADGSVFAVDRTDPNNTVEVVSPDEAADITTRDKLNTRTSTTQADALVNLPGEEITTSTALDMLDSLEQSPGLPGAVGLKGAAQLFGGLNEPLPATDEADFMALQGQVTGAAFLQAFQKLKGGGTITEVEGQNATKAITRLGDRNQSERSYRLAIAELREILEKGLEAERRAARGNFIPETEAEALLRKYPPGT